MDASSVGETKNTSPSKRISGNGFTEIFTGMPARTNGTPISGTANTSCSRSTASTFTSFVLRRTRSPGETRRAPTTPSKGARTCVLASSTSRSSASARATSSSADALSNSTRAETSFSAKQADAPEDLLGQLRARLRLAHVRALLGVAQVEEHVALLDALALG